MGKVPAGLAAFEAKKKPGAAPVSAPLDALIAAAARRSSSQPPAGLPHMGGMPPFGAGAGDQMAPGALASPGGDPKMTAATHLADALGGGVSPSDILILFGHGGPADEGPTDQPGPGPMGMVG